MLPSPIPLHIAPQLPDVAAFREESDERLKQLTNLLSEMARLQGNDKEAGRQKKGGAHAENKISGSSKRRTGGGSSKRNGGEGKAPTPRHSLPTPASSHVHKAFAASDITVTWLGASSGMSEGVEGGEHVAFFRACTITSPHLSTTLQYTVGESECHLGGRRCGTGKG